MILYAVETGNIFNTFFFILTNSVEGTIIRNTGKGSRGDVYSPRLLIVTEPEG